MKLNLYSAIEKAFTLSPSTPLRGDVAILQAKEIVKSVFFVLFTVVSLTASVAQSSSAETAFFIKALHEKALSEGQAYQWLHRLCKQAGPRLAGSPSAAAAVSLTQQIMDTLGFDTVYLQACTEPRWVRGPEASATIVGSQQLGDVPLFVTTLGNSVGTGLAGITAPIIEVKHLEELEQLDPSQIEGKLVFFNRPMDPTQLNTFAAYGAAVDQRVYGASRAAKYGAIGVIVRSMTVNIDDIPHSGTMTYEADVPQIPAIAVATRHAELLSQLLTKEPITVHFKSHGRILPPVKGYNVIGEIRGSEFPNEIILVGGHLDSWDIGEGAHDDGAGCVQAMQVLPLLGKLNYRPKRTLRCVLFANEENGLAGAKAYWEASFAAKEFHLLAIESDRGGFSPKGFSAQADESVFEQYYKRLNTWLPLLEPYGLSFTTGGSGADISGLKAQKGLLLGLVPDSQRYFDYHHTATDVFEAVNKRELELGAAAITSLVYLIDFYGLQ